LLRSAAWALAWLVTKEGLDCVGAKREREDQGEILQKRAGGESSKMKRDRRIRDNLGAVRVGGEERRHC